MLVQFQRDKFTLRILMLLVMAVSRYASALEWNGECVAVTDGDSITVMYHELPLKVRLYGIDAPERKQPFYRVAREYLAEMVHRRMVRIKFTGFDRYNRVVGVVWLDDRCVNWAMLEAGLAWIYKRYCQEPHRGEWQPSELEARRGGLGIWSQPDPTPPWQYRKTNRKK